MLLFLVYFWNFPTTLSETHMALVWGVPNDATSCQNTTISWNECYQKCYEDESCVSTFWNNSICSNCDPVTNISKSDYVNGYKVAMKFNLTSVQCPETSLNASTGTVIANTNQSLALQYEILESSTSWNIEILNTSYRCDDGWAFFQRIKCGWCIKVVDNSSASYDDAVKGCSNEGAVLTAMGSSYSSVTYTLIRVDGTRKAACNTTETFKDCPITFQGSFDFHDHWASDQNGYVSCNPGVVPDGGTTSLPEYTVALYTEPEGLAEDITSMTYPYVTGYACGKPSNV